MGDNGLLPVVNNNGWIWLMAHSPTKKVTGELLVKMVNLDGLTNGPEW